ncbi:Zinc finger protein CTH1 [Trypanosoma conorhini]|uniref:Zinc finger protein CTH1 n=1 Tax=Trypanosoma conorhini TaxID=83891 RepID=A0A3R7KWV1_9TRYP|nr:Zinc finger protein CTH1 [Trypanosoma conorhini]RNF11285.1 Zinc finger protein CTH1 [Trypanosoma conorhini]
MCACVRTGSMAGRYAPQPPAPGAPAWWDCTEDAAASLGYAAAAYGEHEPAARPILAERYKTKLCRNYVETGVCPYQSRCMFAHGVHELRSPAMNLHDGLVTADAIRAFRRRRTAPPYLYAAARGPASRFRASRAAPAAAYTHDPYACDLLPLPSRLYSQPPGLAALFCATAAPSCYSYSDSVENRDGCASCVEVARPPNSYACTNCDAEPSACSSIGSDSEDNRQPTTPRKDYIKEQPPAEVVGDEAATSQ